MSIQRNSVGYDIVKNERRYYKYNSFGSPDYQEVEYIQSTRTQLITLDYYPQINTKLVMDIMFSGAFRNTGSYGGSGFFFGCADTNNVFYANFGANSDQGNEIFNWFGKPYVSSVWNMSINYTTRLTRNTFTANRQGRVSYGTYSRNTEVATGAVNEKVGLFGMTSAFTAYEMTCFTCKIYEGDALMLNLVPCYRIADSTVGMYDTVNNTFYDNVGTGTFVKGGNVLIPATAEDYDYYVDELKPYSITRDGNYY